MEAVEAGRSRYHCLLQEQKNLEVVHLAARGIGVPNSSGETLTPLCDWPARNNKSLCIVNSLNLRCESLRGNGPYRALKANLSPMLKIAVRLTMRSYFSWGQKRRVIQSQ